MLVQEVDAFLQNSGLVHLAGVARQHGAQLLDENIELVSAFLLRLVTGHTVGSDTIGSTTRFLLINFWPLVKSMCCIIDTGQHNIALLDV